MNVELIEVYQVGQYKAYVQCKVGPYLVASEVGVRDQWHATLTAAGGAIPTELVSAWTVDASDIMDVPAVDRSLVRDALIGAAGRLLCEAQDAQVTWRSE